MLKTSRTALVLLLVICLGMTVGCRTRGMRGRGADTLSPVDVLEGDYPLSSWDHPGEPVPGVHFENVLFAFDSSRIDPGERGKIEAVAAHLRSEPRHRVVLEGHCDERGSREYNVALGERRALATRAYMIGLGIDGARVQTRSYGEERPLDPGHDSEAWRANRRVEFAVYR